VNTAHRAPSPRRALPSIALVALITALAACRSAAPGVGSTATPTASASTAVSPSASIAPSNEPTAQPTDDLGPFACDFPVKGSASVNRAQLVDVRVGTHDGYDRVVFEFAKGAPAFTLDEAQPPLREDASGRELDVDGNAFWQLVMRDTSRSDLDGHTMFDDTDFDPEFPKLAELIEGGDFEAVSTWYFGLDAESCVRVLRLSNPSRLVFDIEH
jgi:hypothetical protein